MSWVDTIATAEKGKVPYGAILLASVAEAIGVVSAGALVSKYPQTTKYANPLVGGAGAVLVPQLGKWIGEDGAKALGIGFGCQAVSPYIGRGINSIVGAFTPTPVPAARKPASIAGRPTAYRAPVAATSEEDLAQSATAGAETR